jgi:hypothetical protein
MPIRVARRRSAIFGAGRVPARAVASSLPSIEIAMQSSLLELEDKHPLAAPVFATQSPTAHDGFEPPHLL